MPAIRLIDRLSDLSDFSGPLVAGYVLFWNGTNFVLGEQAAFAGSVIGELPVGQIDGSNATFNVVNDFVPLSVEVFTNGILQVRNRDFNTSGTRTIILAYSPAPGEVITVNYRKAG